MPDLQELLERFTRVRGVAAAVLAGTDGLVLHGVTRPDAEVDLEALGAMASSWAVPAQELGREIGCGRLVQSALEYEQGLVVVEPVADAALLAVVSDRVESLGIVRLTARRLREDLRKALTE
jgi:predicted regulator of Ras-like GTPase activity (Roadblock/LC7/MglB family)